MLRDEEMKKMCCECVVDQVCALWVFIRPRPGCSPFGFKQAPLTALHCISQETIQKIKKTIVGDWLIGFTCAMAVPLDFFRHRFASNVTFLNLLLELLFNKKNNPEQTERSILQATHC